MQKYKISIANQKKLEQLKHDSFNDPSFTSFGSKVIDLTYLKTARDSLTSFMNTCPPPKYYKPKKSK
jgi:hypothetical protein